VHYPAYGISVYRHHGKSVYHDLGNSAYHFHLDLAEILELLSRLEPSEHPIDEEQRIRLRYQFYSLRRKLDPRRFLG